MRMNIGLTNAGGQEKKLQLKLMLIHVSWVYKQLFAYMFQVRLNH